MRGAATPRFIYIFMTWTGTFLAVYCLELSEVRQKRYVEAPILASDFQISIRNFISVKTGSLQTANLLLGRRFGKYTCKYSPKLDVKRGKARNCNCGQRSVKV